MGDDTFRNGPGAPGVRLAAAARGSGAGEAAAGVREPGVTRTATGLADHAKAAAALAGQAPAAPAATYWRRRLVVLAIGLAVLAAAVWGLSEALRVQPRPVQPGSGAGARPSGSPGAGGSGQAGTARGRTSQGPRAAGNSPGGRAGPGRHATVSARPSASASGFGGFKPAFCSWHSIVLSVSAAQASFGPGEQPGFSLNVVSTQPADCSFNVGPGHLALVIREGPTRIWSSADCVSGSPNLVAALRRGIPTVVSIGWDRHTSSPGCSPARPVPAGDYTAYAVDGSLASPPVTFRLG